MYVTVKDKRTGHHYDVREDRVKEFHQVLKRPPHRYAKPPKLKVDLKKETRREALQDPLPNQNDPNTGDEDASTGATDTNEEGGNQ